jgi:YesN/AraC family two-component response regulator
VLSGHPDLVVSDVSMPVMDGIALCRKIKTDKRTSFIPVVLLTALSREEDQIKGLQTEANDYLTKPFSFEILNTRIKNLIRLNQRLKDTFSKHIQMIVPETEVQSTDEKLLNDISMFIEERLNDPEFSIEELSSHIGMSRSSLYNKLFELTGQPPIDYVRAIKLQKAASLLEKSHFTIREIAFMTGFATPGYFSKVFKKKYNLSPSEFLNLKKNKTKEARTNGGATG